MPRLPHTGAIVAGLQR